jgi:GT2 family glycosyltransferase
MGTKVSIAIPVKTVNRYLMECIDACLRLDYPDFEILVFPDRKERIDRKGVRVIPTGDVPPPVKRDLVLKHARGDILAFIDDDAYPRRDWLKNAVAHFRDRRVGAVGGPAVTPESDSIRQKASGLVFGSAIGGGLTRGRYKASSGVTETDDWPTVNFIVRRGVFREFGGFDNEYWPGEDTKLCLDIVKSGYRIIQDPNVLVYHHRRGVFRPHLEQVKRYALHRGFFVKRFPQTSLRIGYFVPSLFVAFLFLGFLATLVFTGLQIFYLFVLYSYLLLVFLSSINRNLKLFYLTFTGIILTHITYGIYFIKGLLSGRMER